MKTLNPFIPTVPLISVPSRSRRERFKKVVFLVLAAHVALLVGLLMNDYHRDLVIYAREMPGSASAPGEASPEALAAPAAVATVAVTKPQAAAPASAVPAPKVASTVAKAAAPTAPARPEAWHTVQSGDTLNDIARKYGTTPKAIKAANNLASEHLRVSQKLRIP